MCSGCSGDVEEGGVVTCLSCGTDYLGADGLVLPCHRCHEPVCHDCRDAHEAECALSSQDCLS